MKDFFTQNRTAIKTNSIALLSVGAGIIIYSLLRKGQAAGTLNFNPDKVRGFSFDGGTPVIDIGIAVQNTSNQSFTVNSLSANLYSLQYNKTYVGNVSTFTPQTIGPNSQKILVVQARLALIGLANDILTAIQYGNFQQEVELTGYANVDNLQIPINLKFRIP